MSSMLHTLAFGCANVLLHPASPCCLQVAKELAHNVNGNCFAL